MLHLVLGMTLELLMDTIPGSQVWPLDPHSRGMMFRLTFPNVGHALPSQPVLVTMPTIARPFPT